MQFKTLTECAHPQLKGSANPGIVPDLLHEILITRQSKFEESALMSVASGIFTGQSSRSKEERALTEG